MYMHPPPVGGHPGAFGKNVLKRKKDNSIHDLGPKASAQMFPGVSYIDIFLCHNTCDLYKMLV